MKRFSRKWFAQIMIHKQLKQELDELKKVFTIKYKINYKLSYADVIRILINEYKKPFRVVYPLSQKTLVGTKIKRQNLKVVSTFSRQTTSVSSKLDGKPRVSFLLES
jgi:hypothetical protein